MSNDTYTVHYFHTASDTWKRSRTIHSAKSLTEAAAVMGKGFKPYFSNVKQVHGYVGDLHIMVTEGALA